MKAGTPRTVIANCPGAAVSGAGRYDHRVGGEERAGGEHDVNTCHTLEPDHRHR